MEKQTDIQMNTHNNKLTVKKEKFHCYSKINSKKKFEYQKSIIQSIFLTMEAKIMFINI